MNNKFKSSAEDIDPDLAGRLFRVMALSVALAVVMSLPLAPWRVTTGLILGGSLSLLNFHWLRISLAAAFSQAEQGSRPRIRLAKYILRYLIIGVAVFFAYKLSLVSLPATVAGLSSFVVALFAEALRETYFIIIRREGIH